MSRFGRGRHRPGHMNKTEAAYGLVLEARRRQGEILWYSFEAVKLKLADKTYYTPDYLVMTNDNWLEFHEVKGFWEDDARVKIKCAAEKFPFKFIAVSRKGGWKAEEI